MKKFLIAVALIAEATLRFISGNGFDAQAQIVHSIITYDVTSTNSDICSSSAKNDSILCFLSQKFSIYMGGAGVAGNSALRKMVEASPNDRGRVFNYHSVTEHRTVGSGTPSIDARWRGWCKNNLGADSLAVYEGIYMHFDTVTAVRYWKCSGTCSGETCSSGNTNGCSLGEGTRCYTKTYPAYDSGDPKASRVPHPLYSGYTDSNGCVKEFTRMLLNWRNPRVLHEYLKFVVMEVYKQELPGGGGSGPWFEGIFADNAMWGPNFEDQRLLYGGKIKEAQDAGETFVRFDCNFQVGETARTCDSNMNNKFSKWYRTNAKYHAFMVALDDTLENAASWHPSGRRGWLMRNASKLSLEHTGTTPSDSMFSLDAGDIMWMEFIGSLTSQVADFPERMRVKNNLSSSNDLGFSPTMTGYGCSGGNCVSPASGTCGTNCLPFSTVMYGDLALMQVVRDKDATGGWGSPFYGRQQLWCATCPSNLAACGSNGSGNYCCGNDGQAIPTLARQASCVPTRTWITAFEKVVDSSDDAYMGAPTGESTTLSTSTVNGFTYRVYRRTYNGDESGSTVGALAYARARDADPGNPPTSSMDSVATDVAVTLPNAPNGKVWRKILADGTLQDLQFTSGEDFLIANARGALWKAVPFDVEVPCKTPSLCEEICEWPCEELGYELPPEEGQAQIEETAVFVVYDVRGRRVARGPWKEVNKVKLPSGNYYMQQVGTDKPGKKKLVIK